MKFRRKSAQPDAVEETAAGADRPRPPVGPAGPFDVDDVAGDDVERVDLGSLLIAPEPGRELRLQVDEATQAVQSVVLAGPDGALELRAFAAPATATSGPRCARSSPPTWPAAAAPPPSARAASAPSWSASCSVKTNDGRTAQQPSRIIGINGPRWMLRGHVPRPPGRRARERRRRGRTPSPRWSSAAASTRCRSATRCR